MASASGGVRTFWFESVCGDALAVCFMMQDGEGTYRGGEAHQAVDEVVTRELIRLPIGDAERVRGELEPTDAELVGDDGADDGA